MSFTCQAEATQWGSLKAVGIPGSGLQPPSTGQAGVCSAEMLSQPGLGEQDGRVELPVPLASSLNPTGSFSLTGSASEVAHPSCMSLAWRFSSAGIAILHGLSLGQCKPCKPTGGGGSPSACFFPAVPAMDILDCVRFNCRPPSSVFLGIQG